MSTSAAGNPTAACRWCGLLHGPRCFAVKALEFHEDGVTVKRVEFETPAATTVVGPAVPRGSYVTRVDASTWRAA